MLGHETSINTFKSTEIMQNKFSGHSAIFALNLMSDFLLLGREVKLPFFSLSLLLRTLIFRFLFFPTYKTDPM